MVSKSLKEIDLLAPQEPGEIRRRNGEYRTPRLDPNHDLNRYKNTFYKFAKEATPVGQTPKTDIEINTHKFNYESRTGTFNTRKAIELA